VPARDRLVTASHSVPLKPQPQKSKPLAKISKLPPSIARILTAVVLLPVLIVSIVVPSLDLLFVGLAVAAMVLALFEFWLLVKRQQVRADVTAGYLGAASLLTVFYFTEPGKWIDFGMLQGVILILTMGSLAAAMVRGAPFERMIMSVGATVLGVLYVVLLGGHLIAVRVGFQPGLARHLLAFFFLVIMSADSAAYYAGRIFGRHKLAPTISPGKTWEGAVGGLMISLLAAALSHFWFFPELPLKLALPLAAVMNLLSIVGDLTESALKRSAGAKNTANILPGHGGVLDRIDSLLFNAPLIYYFARLYFK
jgi:phosphatidate cytidylyltransferase